MDLLLNLHQTSVGSGLTSVDPLFVLIMNAAVQDNEDDKVGDAYGRGGWGLAPAWVLSTISRAWSRVTRRRTL